MSRLERFRRYRRYKRGLRLSILFFIILLSLGIITVQNVVDLTLGAQMQQRLFNIEKRGDEFYEISFIGKDIKISIDNIRKVLFIIGQ